MVNAQAGGVVIRTLDQPGDLGWVVMAHGEVYAEEFGWDTSFEALVARIVADYASGHDPEREAAWIAEVDGRRAGCILCVAADDSDGAQEANDSGGAEETNDSGGAKEANDSGGAKEANDSGGAKEANDSGGAERAGGRTAKLRILLVHPGGRGHGLGGRLVDTALEFAHAAGYRRARLWTNHTLLAARSIYLDRGFVLIGEQPHHSFGVDLVGQTYELDLVDAPGIDRS